MSWGRISAALILCLRDGNFILPGAEPFVQLRPPASSGYIAHRNCHGLLLAHKDDQPLAAGDASIEQVALQHGVVLRQHRDDHGRIL